MDKIGSRITKKQWLIVAVIACFVTILIYELLTPMYSDDFGYQARVNEAESIADLFRQERDHYMQWTGRSVVHMIMRLFMYTQSHTFFHVCAAAVFTLLTLCVYHLTEMTGGLSPTRYLLGVLLLWIFGVEFAETVLWQTGACNYLFGTTIILCNMVVYYRLYKGDKGDGSDCHPGKQVTVRTVPFVTALGLLAGWCNENTSGGLILYALIVLFYMKKIEKRKVPAAFYAGIVANITGFAFMILAPGNLNRASLKDADSNPIMRYAARFLSVTNSIYELFFPLLVVAIIIGVALHYRKVPFVQAKGYYLFLLLFAATSYALIAAPAAENRAFFGAGVFLFIALIRGLELLCEHHDDHLEVTGGLSHLSPASQGDRGTVPSVTSCRAIRLAITLTLLLYMAFTYIDCGAKLAWIYREEAERNAYLSQMAASGAEESGAAILRPQFDNKYTVAYDMDIQEDWRYWINWMYADYYGMRLVWGVERDEWTEY